MGGPGGCRGVRRRYARLQFGEKEEKRPDKLELRGSFVVLEFARAQGRAARPVDEPSRLEVGMDCEHGRVAGCGWLPQTAEAGAAQAAVAGERGAACDGRSGAAGHHALAKLFGSEEAGGGLLRRA